MAAIDTEARVSTDRLSWPNFDSGLLYYLVPVPRFESSITTASTRTTFRHFSAWRFGAGLRISFLTA